MTPGSTRSTATGSISNPEDFVEYFIFNNLSRNGDGMLISMFPWKGDDGKLRMGPAWDYNWSSYYIGGGPTGTPGIGAIASGMVCLFNDPDFEQLYVDRWFYHRDRAMSNAGWKTSSIVRQEKSDWKELFGKGFQAKLIGPASKILQELAHLARGLV